MSASTSGRVGARVRTAYLQQVYAETLKDHPLVSAAKKQCERVQDEEDAYMHVRHTSSQLQNTL
jgi:hypothetical protein